MIRPFTSSAVLSLLIGIGIAHAAPATQPGAKADFSTPLAALRTNKLPMKNGDAALMKRAMYTADAQEQKAIDTIMDSFAAQVRFQEACAKRFGDEAGERVAPQFNLEIPPDAREQIDGDRAKLVNIGGPKPTTLRRIDGEWRFTYGSLVDNNFRDLPPMPPARLVEVFQTGIDMYKALCDDVAAGKFERVEDAMNALRARQQDRGKAIREIIGKPRE